ncbi:class II aldolase/adducin family protein [Halocynthiibacter sp. C4]|uniref:class II aldolase/adducin family protein n=1 Tax=Halocynthiibacter sp. C4 TaxID=2992758 RepID=UPI00237ACFE7|nr:class II aldolase/adducin family protein [Halocynthiibacter sp. C4]MDE0590017.1 class II aldolase/adducin family protein [Halocynthiibacter sp. C4]
MTSQNKLRERICLFARFLYDRGLTHGSTGNISVRLLDGSLSVTPTGCSFGFLDPADIALSALPESTSAAILANHGPIVAGATLEKTVFALEELEATARLALETAGSHTRLLTRKEIRKLISVFDLEI